MDGDWIHAAVEGSRAAREERLAARLRATLLYALGAGALAVLAAAGALCWPRPALAAALFLLLPLWACGIFVLWLAELALAAAAAAEHAARAVTVDRRFHGTASPLGPPRAEQTWPALAGAALLGAAALAALVAGLVAVPVPWWAALLLGLFESAALAFVGLVAGRRLR